MKTSNLKKIINRMAGKKILVVGDLMVDEYIFGETTRISREAPVLILTYRGRHIGCGGAANAVANIRALGGIPVPVGVVGEDDNGNSLIEKFETDGIPTSGILRDPVNATISKTRIMAGGMHTIRQQIVRIDREPEKPANADAIIKKTKQLLKEGVDGFLVSDYGSGALSPDVIRFVNTVAKKKEFPLAIDSRYQLSAYRNAVLLAPNEEEAGISEGFVADDLKKIEAVCEKLRRKVRSSALMVTRGSEGLSLFQEGKKPVHIPVFGSKSAVDTTGAGDTVVTTALLSLAAGASVHEAAYLSNRSGGLVVMKKGAATISPEELLGTL